MSLPEWYGEREVLLTGGTSELGRNLLEKLLRSFPDIKVHMIIRPRYDLTVEQRVERNIFGAPGFERLRQERPDAIKRVRSYEGNLIHDNLGLTEKSQNAIRNVSVVFHAAGPSANLINFCKKLPNLKAAVVAGEIFRSKLDLVPERALEDENLPDDSPVALLRLPILGPAHRDPMPGYVEVLRNATALMVGAGYAYGRSDLPAEIIPMDIAANSFIMVARDVEQRSRQEKQLVYNASTINCSWGELIRKGDRANRKFRYPTFRVRGITSSAFLHWFVVFLFEWLPSFICDTIFYLIGRKQRLLPEHKRIRKLLSDFEPTMFRVLNVTRRKIRDLTKIVSEEDKDMFPVLADIDIEAYLLCAAAATRKYCVDESNLKVVTFFLPLIMALLLLGCSYFYYFML